MDRIYQGDALDVLRGFPDESIDCCITSPPYYGLRNYQVDGQIGLESTPEEYVGKLVEVFREVRRVLKDQGTLWLNLGDSYSGSGARDKTPGGTRGIQKNNIGSYVGKCSCPTTPDGYKPKDLLGIPWMVAFALRADGWYLRSDIIWAKGNPMPESVTDRPTKAHEYLFLFAKSQRYYYDAEAIKEDSIHSGKKVKIGEKSLSKGQQTAQGFDKHWGTGAKDFLEVQSSRNKRSVWHINTKPFKEAHFATFPEDLITPCILAGTSEKGVCPGCGKPWIRQTEKDSIQPVDYEGKCSKQDKQFSGRRISANTRARRLAGGEHDNPFPPARTVGWASSCECGLDPSPAIVLDPFFGAGTTGLVARKLLRHYIGIELNPAYIDIANRRLSKIPARLDAFCQEAL